MDNYYKELEIRKKSDENYEIRFKYATNEFKELFNIYAPPEYKKGGLFRTKRFKKIEKQVNRKVEKQILKLNLDTNDEYIDEFYKLKQKILKDK